MTIVKPLIIYVMMERKYQLVAWTENITSNENARLYLTPSLESEVQASLISDLAFIHKEEHKSHGRISLDLARRAIRAYENMSRFEILTGHFGDGIQGSVGYQFGFYCDLSDRRLPSPTKEYHQCIHGEL